MQIASEAHGKPWTVRLSMLKRANCPGTLTCVSVKGVEPTGAFPCFSLAGGFHVVRPAAGLSGIDVAGDWMDEGKKSGGRFYIAPRIRKLGASATWF
jgi:hypothetical protein